MVKNFSRKVVSQYHKYLRVWRLLRKPTIEEFTTVSKVSAVGLLLIGAIGFAIAVIVKLIFKF